MSVQPTPSGAVPRGWNVDHDAPTDFVVRCTSCGKIAIKSERSEAHRRADNHAIRCSPAGVTPVSRPEPDTPESPDGPDSGPAVGLHVDPEQHSLVREELEIGYESVSSRAGLQEVTGDVVAMCPAPKTADGQYRGLIIRLPSQARRRIDFVDDEVECPHDGDPDGWQKIGDLERISPAISPEDAPVVMTDGGSTTRARAGEALGDVLQRHLPEYADGTNADPHDGGEP